MVLRLLSHWRQWCGDNQFPSFTDVNPVEMAEIWDYCFVLDFVGYEHNPIVRIYAGTDPELPAVGRAATHADRKCRRVLLGNPVPGRADFARRGICEI